MKRVVIVLAVALAFVQFAAPHESVESTSVARFLVERDPRLSPAPDSEVHDDHHDEDDHVESFDAVRTQSTGTLRALLINVAHPGGPTLSRDAVAAASNSAAAMLLSLSRGMLTIEPTMFPVDVVVAGVADPCTQYAAISEQALSSVRTQTNVADYQLLTYFFGAPGGGSCPGWAGRGQRPGNTTWNLIADDVVVAHEWGHNIGLDHLRAIRCTQNGVAVPFVPRAERGACETREYGGAFSLMGGAESARLTFAERSQLGWMRPGEEKGVTSGIHTLGADGPTALLWVQNAEGDLFTLEFTRALNEEFPGQFFETWERRWFPIGEAPDWTHAGVMIRHVTSLRSGSTTGSGWTHSSAVLDFNPQTLRATDAAMRAGQSWVDGTGSLIVETLETLGDAATVRVTAVAPSASAPAQPAAVFVAPRRLSVSVRPAPFAVDGTRYLVQVATTRSFAKAHGVLLDSASGEIRIPASMARLKRVWVRIGAVAPDGTRTFAPTLIVSR